MVQDPSFSRDVQRFASTRTVLPERLEGCVGLSSGAGDGLHVFCKACISTLYCCQGDLMLTKKDNSILPALAFSLDMFHKTGMQYGVNEVLLASVLGAVVFSMLSCQPLVIVGVTGPITVFNYTVYDIMMPTGTNYLAFMCWIGM